MVCCADGVVEGGSVGLGEYGQQRGWEECVGSSGVVDECGDSWVRAGDWGGGELEPEVGLGELDAAAGGEDSGEGAVVFVAGEEVVVVSEVVEVGAGDVLGSWGSEPVGGFGFSDGDAAVDAFAEVEGAGGVAASDGLWAADDEVGGFGEVGEVSGVVAGGHGATFVGLTHRGGMDDAVVELVVVVRDRTGRVLVGVDGLPLGVVSAQRHLHRSALEVATAALGVPPWGLEASRVERLPDGVLRVVFVAFGSPQPGQRWLEPVAAVQEFPEYRAALVSSLEPAR